nr:CSP5 [Frankliniella intonsa]
MKSAACVCLCLAALAALALAEDKYTNKFDNVNVDDILKNQRLLDNYFKCLMDKGRCTPDGAELKKSLPDALTSRCSKCTEKQKMQTEKVVRFLIEKKPVLWQELKAKYDPQGQYEATYKQEAVAHGIKV